MKLCLASTSPRRHQLLASSGLPFFFCDPDIEELSEDCLPPALLAQTNARLKSQAVAGLHPDAVVIAADTVVGLDGKALGKPVDLDAAHQMLELLGGRWHEVFTGVCIQPPKTPGITINEAVEFVVCSRVLLRSFSHTQREEYFKKVSPLDKAGAYAAQETATNLVQSIEGSLTNVVGLPMESLLPLLKENFPQLFQ